MIHTPEQRSQLIRIIVQDHGFSHDHTVSELYRLARYADKYALEGESLKMQAFQLVNMFHDEGQ